MTAAYAKAAIPEPFQILGLRLKPLCIGHYLHMSRFNVAFVAEDSAEATLEDLLLGVLICSKTYEEFSELLQQSNFIEQVKKWGKEIGLFDWNEKAKLFLRYIEEGSRVPKFWKESDGVSSAAHWTQTVKLVLTSECNYSNSEALNLPLTQAFADYCKFCESKGVMRLMTDAEIEMIEAAEVAQREKEATCPN